MGLYKKNHRCLCGGRPKNAAWWKVFGVMGWLIGVFFAVVSLGLKKRNDDYLDALIRLSDDLPDDEGEAAK